VHDADAAVLFISKADKAVKDFDVSTDLDSGDPYTVDYVFYAVFGAADGLPVPI
jgi:hypothetical protein